MCYEKRDPKIARECFIRDQGGKMDHYTSTAMAYNDGYEQGYAQGKKDAVKPAKWVSHDFDVTFSCSLCDFTTDFRLSNYCPECGAHMEGGNEDG